jgi:hypothetical protein
MLYRREYRRWQRETPTALWQLDLVGGIYLARDRECRLLSGIDDHSRYVVIAAVPAVPPGWAVADAFAAAMKTYGVPAEVLTDNGKQFTGRFTKPRPAEVLFERVCREHGITAKLAKPYSPDHHRQGGTLAPDAAPRAARRLGPVRGPALGAGGDIVYNNIHMWLWNSTPESRAAWLSSIDAVAALKPATIITGHRDPDALDDDAIRVLDQSRRYIEDFETAVAKSSSPPEVIAAMMEKYSAYGNPYTLFAAAAYTQFTN